MTSLRRNAVALLVHALAGVTLFGQALRVDTIREAQPWGGHEVYTFPLVRTPDRPEIASRINRDICLEFLEVDPDTAREGIFTKVWGDFSGKGMPSVNALTWSWSHPWPHMISIELVGEFCGAYCEEFDIHYNYDLRNGRRLQYDGLFTPPGLHQVTDSLSRAWRATLQNTIHGIEEQLAMADTSSYDGSILRGSRELYAKCLEERASPQLEHFEPRSSGMRVRMARSSSHFDRALDELDAVELELGYAWLTPFFNPDSKAMFAR